VTVNNELGSVQHSRHCQKPLHSSDTVYMLRYDTAVTKYSKRYLPQLHKNKG